MKKITILNHGFCSILHKDLTSHHLKTATQKSWGQHKSSTIQSEHIMEIWGLELSGWSGKFLTIHTKIGIPMSVTEDRKPKWLKLQRNKTLIEIIYSKWYAAYLISIFIVPLGQMESFYVFRILVEEKATV